MNAETAGHVGTPQLKQFHMVYTKEFPRGISDQAISQANSTRGLSGVRSGPGLKRQASSSKRLKQQAASFKPQATSVKLQAASSKLTEHGPFIKFLAPRTKVLCQDKAVVWVRYMVGNLVW